MRTLTIVKTVNLSMVFFLLLVGFTIDVFSCVFVFEIEVEHKIDRGDWPTFYVT